MYIHGLRRAIHLFKKCEHTNFQGINNSLKYSSILCDQKQFNCSVILFFGEKVSNSMLYEISDHLDPNFKTLKFEILKFFELQEKSSSLLIVLFFYFTATLVLKIIIISN
jgi:hypothetical protein